MATSGITDWTQTAGDIVTRAMRQVTILSSGENPTDEEMDDGINELNGMLKTWQVEANLFRNATATLTIPAGTGAATLPTDVRAINSARHVISATNERPLNLWNRDEWMALPNRATVGAYPTAFVLNKTIDGLELRIWPVPATDITVNLDYSRVAETVTAPNQTVDVPQDWTEAVVYNLASRIAGMFGASRTDPQAVQRVDARANALYQRLLDADRPDSYYFYPNEGCC